MSAPNRHHARPPRSLAPRHLALIATAVAAACLALVGAGRGSIALAQDEPGRAGDAQVRSGTCASPGDEAALLEPITIPASAERPGIAASITDVMLPLAELTASPHVILVQDPGSAGGSICGPISGPPTAEEGVAAALVDAEGRIAGIAWLRELGIEATTVHVFVVASRIEPFGDGAADESPGPRASPSPLPSASPTPEPGVSLDEEIDPGDDIDVDVDG